VKQPFNLDREFIKWFFEFPYPDLGSNRAMVFSYGLGLFAHNNVNTFSYGYDKLRFIKPTFIGDTIYGMRTLLEKTPKYENMGLFKVSYEIFRADNEELVLYTEHLQTVLYRTSQAENLKAEGKE
jgi:acyl dehydratase